MSKYINTVNGTLWILKSFSCAGDQVRAGLRGQVWDNLWDSGTWSKSKFFDYKNRLLLGLEYMARFIIP